MILDTVL